MPTHDIIDNRKEKLVDHINRILSSTESARLAVGYFFLSGLESIAQRLAGVKELRLLIGNTTNRETLEQLAEGYRRLELVAEAAEAEAYRKRTETKRIARRHTRRQDVHAQGPVRFLRSHLSRTRNRQGFPAIVPSRCRRHCGLERHAENPRRDQVRSGTEKPAAATEVQRGGDAGATPVRRRSEEPASRAHAYLVIESRTEVYLARIARAVCEIGRAHV